MQKHKARYQEGRGPYTSFPVQQKRRPDNGFSVSFDLLPYRQITAGLGTAPLQDWLCSHSTDKH